MATRDAPETSPKIAATRAADSGGRVDGDVRQQRADHRYRHPTRRLADEAAAVDRNAPVRLYERLVPVPGQHRVLLHAAHD